jgi:hypothetical protein
MFGIFDSKTQKLVKKWKKEHQQLVELAGSVIHEYTVHNQKEAKKSLSKLSGLASSHFMNEDLEFFKLLRDGKLDNETAKSVKDFTEGFKKVKIELMSFFTNYSKPDVPLDDEFFKHFNEIIDAVGQRIAYEEGNLYELMATK